MYPYGYGTSFRTLEWIRDWLLVHHHPEYVRRFCAWLESKGGEVGPGGGWRDDGTQPDKPGFAPEGKSFHQNQQYNDGFIGACAVDVVRRNPNDGPHLTVRWSDVPAQGSGEARAWGVHANVATEAWHIQPIEIDGWQSWMDAGQPAPRAGYRLPGEIVPPTPPMSGALEVYLVLKYGSDPDKSWSGYYSDGNRRYGISAATGGMNHCARLVKAGAKDARTGEPVTSATWADVSNVTTVAELERWLGPA